MQNIEKYRINHLSKYSQMVLLDKEAYIQSSCDSLFSTQDLSPQSIRNSFPFLDSIFEQLQALTPADPEIRFIKVETPIPQLPGVYDFSFSAIALDQRDLILWRIYDYTALYEDLKVYQQRRNELEIHRELLENRQKKLTREEDVLNVQNLILENLNHLQLDYYNRIRTIFYGPVNSLDGLTFGKENAQEDYIFQLQEATLQLQAVLKELPEIDAVIKAKSFQPLQIVSQLKKDLESLDKEAISSNFTTNIDEQVPLKMQGNGRRLYRVLYLLSQNIIQFHPQSKLQLDLSTEEEEGKRMLKIQLLEQFQREYTPVLSAEATQCLFWRLSLVRQLVDLAQGQLSVTRDAESCSIIIHCNLPFTLT